MARLLQAVIVSHFHGQPARHESSVQAAISPVDWRSVKEVGAILATYLQDRLGAGKLLYADGPTEVPQGFSVDARPVEAAQITHAGVRRINIEHTMAPGYGRVRETRWHPNVASVSSAEDANSWFFEHVLLLLQSVELNSQCHSGRHGRLLGVWNA
jgi:hypothetical protein